MPLPFETPNFRPDLPIYPATVQLLRITGTMVPGPSGVAQLAGSSILAPRLYVASTQQSRTDSLLPRDREPCLADDVAGLGLAPGFYLGRLAGSFNGLPVYTVIAGSGSVSSTGPAGPQGPQGVPGPAGPTGSTGNPGTPGSPGPAGSTGNPGTQGTTGATGATGSTGQPGTQGSPGPQGPPGPAGSTGNPGTQGSPGPQGPQGPQGPVGSTGPQGPAGTSGLNWVKVTKTYADLATAATTNTITLYTLSAKEVVHASIVKHSQVWAGGSLSDVTVEVRCNGNPVNTAWSLFTAVTNTNFQNANQNAFDPPYLKSFGATDNVQIYAQSYGDNLNAATQGSLDVWLLLSTLP